MRNAEKSRQVMWRALGRPGLERARLLVGEDEVTAWGVAVGAVNGTPYSLRYDIRCDAEWRTRSLRVESLLTGQTLVLRSNGRGRWTGPKGRPEPHLNGCLDPDLSVSPLTNMLPIRRTGLKQGAQVDVPVVYIDLPAMETGSRVQRYAFLARHAAGATYRYEGGLTTSIEVDPDGLVVNYPHLFEQIASIK